MHFHTQLYTYIQKHKHICRYMTHISNKGKKKEKVKVFTKEQGYQSSLKYLEGQPMDSL